MSSLQADRAALLALGRDITPALLGGTRALYARAVEAPSPALCTVRRDVPYGPHERHRLDLYVPTSAAPAPRPVLLFVHGGGFVAGDKGPATDPFYANIGAWAARQGFIGVTMNYRLAPAATWPAGIEDVARAVDHLRAGVSAHGGDAQRLVVFGQSAGAVHVAGYVAGLAATHAAAAPLPVAGAVMASGLYDLTTLTHSPREAAYFGTDAARFAAQSPLAGLLQTPLPCLHTVSAWDPPTFQQQAAQLVQAHLAARGVWPRLHYLHGHNHVSPVLSLGARSEAFAELLLDFVRQPEGGCAPSNPHQETP